MNHTTSTTRRNPFAPADPFDGIPNADDHAYDLFPVRDAASLRAPLIAELEARFTVDHRPGTDPS